MSQDIDTALGGWEYKPGVVQARLVEAGDSREVIQMRVDLGLLQLETTGRPDGARPFGCATILDHLRKQVRGRSDFVLSEEQCAEADREFLQFYHRRLCWLALHRFDQAVADADHTLALMDFVRDHSPGDEYTQAHEQYRGFVLFHRTQAAAALAIEQDKPEAAVDAIRAGLEGIRAFYAGFEAEEQMEEDALVRRLREMERLLREKHHIDATLREQLDEAIAREDYERAAQLRDALRRRE
ncbi:MAG TPA: UvrB/UvrC motif-containing protein [Gemmataceae bacterium]|nr:UvrB/UvrC motif-containing protein [Gemmataceae bacterium]